MSSRTSVLLSIEDIRAIFAEDVSDVFVLSSNDHDEDDARCSWHPDRPAVLVISGEGICEDCAMNVICPACGHKEVGRPLLDDGITLTCVCGHEWPLTHGGE